ncbi:MAG: colanic acid biosynthesis glycosyltransferase WcaL [Wenzhouxiangella sp.]|nr:MAG: colanic acid biosynthesis glycosyltransferase WcaL [Wenzhouxiangella sp.]
MNTSSAERRLAYLVSEYPATSHTFILREVIGLRAKGFRIVTASINPDLRPAESVTGEERAERETTYVLKRHGLSGALKALSWTLWRHPRGLARGLKNAIKRAAVNPRLAHKHFFHLIEALMVGRWMNRQQTDHLHVHFATAGASIASLTRQVFPITLSMMVHGPDEFAHVDREYFSEKVAAADFVFCISHFARSQTQYHSSPAHWDKIDVVRLGIDPSVFKPSERSADNGFSILCVGRLTPAKGQHLLLDALARLRARHLSVRLHLVGNGPDRDSLQARCRELGLEDQVEFHGALNHDQVRTMYARADAFVLPSFAEGIPVVLMEAMATGLPCISTRITGIPELIKDGETGFTTAASDVDELVERLEQLINDPALREQLGRAGRQQVCESYNLARNVDILAERFQTRLAGLP